jgi:hypothetical protein
MLSLRQVFTLANTPFSKRATARKFLEEWVWWRALGWEMLAHDTEDGRLLLFTSKKNVPVVSALGARRPARKR